MVFPVVFPVPNPSGFRWYSDTTTVVFPVVGGNYSVFPVVFPVVGPSTMVSPVVFPVVGPDHGSFPSSYPQLQ